MNQCPSCNHSVSPQATTCPSCGHPLRETSGEQFANCGCMVMNVIGGFIALVLIKDGGVMGVIAGIGIAAAIVFMLQKREPAPPQ